MLAEQPLGVPLSEIGRFVAQRGLWQLHPSGRRSAAGPQRLLAPVRLMERFTYEARDENATRLLGAALAKVLPDGTTVALCGTLGAGKTRLVQAIAEASGVERREVVSPTFVLIQEHCGRRPIYHIDAYRLRDEDEFLQLGPEEYFESAGLTLIEWADRVARCLPRQRIEIHAEVTGPESRRFTVVDLAGEYQTVIDQLRRRLA